jgi:serine protease Do
MIPGDIILEFEGTEVITAEELVAEIHKRQPGDKVEIVVLRQAQKRTLPVTLEAML